jgi:hypothetical protein
MAKFHTELNGRWLTYVVPIGNAEGVSFSHFEVAAVARVSKNE